MVCLSRVDLSKIADTMYRAYLQLPQIRGKEIKYIEPMLFVSQLLDLKLEYHYLSRDGSVLGVTSFDEMYIRVYDSRGRPQMRKLDGKTIMIDKRFLALYSNTGRRNFSIMHECAHQILFMLYPRWYGAAQYSNHRVICYRDESSMMTGSDWVEWQANVLAACLLMPEQLIRRGMAACGIDRRIERLDFYRDCNTFCRFIALADELGVSRQALAIRMNQLGLLGQWSLRNPYDSPIDIIPEEVFEEDGNHI